MQFSNIVNVLFIFYCVTNRLYATTMLVWQQLEDVAKWNTTRCSP